jgi:TolB-like protein/tRNA A-37 threonylcarbamoyl transferase component Bud32
MSLRDQLQAALGQAYTLDRELTGGGMSRVFVATETALGRQVVVKVLHPELAAEVTAERFAREIQVVAKLQQANIVPLLTAGHTGQLPFYTMPYVTGQSLRERLTVAGRLPVTEAIQVLRDVARALAHAHESGVVHRDIKPENILLSGGAAVVTDFGIAKAVSASRVEGSTITSVGAGIGTPSYMAPEQAAGDPATDHRADIYAFGCLAFELLSGKPPFDEPSVHEIVAAHMTKAAPDLKARRDDVPTALAQLISLCLEKQPSRRPQHATELLGALDTLITPLRASSNATRIIESRRTVLFAVGLAIGAAAMIVWTATLRSRGGGSGAAEPTVAVIPFANVGGDSAQDYLADGVSDELATALGKLPGIQLAARSASYRYRGRRDADVREIGKALQVRYVVQGTLRRVDQQLRVSAQLTDAETGRELWSDTFDRTTQDVFRLQDDIREAIARELASRSPGSGATAVATAAPASRGPGTANAEAYDLYMRGVFAMRRRQIPEATRMFREAIARDGAFARAHSGLAHALALSPYFTPTPQPEVFDKVVASASAALQRDSSLAEAWMSLALAHMQNWRWAEAATYFDRAVAEDSLDAQVHFQRGRFQFYRGDEAGALASWNRGSAIDPFFAVAVSWRAVVIGLQGRHGEAVAEMTRALEYDSTAAVVKQNAARVFLLAGQRDRAVAIGDRLPDVPPWSGMRAYVHGAVGDRQTALARIRQLEALPPSTWMRHTSLAYGYLGIGDTARTLDALARATDARELWPAYHSVTDSLFNPVRASARWAALLKRVGLGDVRGAAR